MLNKRPIKLQRNGNYAVKLTDHERDVLRDLPGELLKMMAVGSDDRAMFRLFPRAYDNDLGRQVEYDRLMRDDLQSRHAEALKTLEETAGAKELTPEQIDNWTKALNQLRLVLGTRLDVTDNTTEDDFEADSATLGAYSLYSYLGYLQDAAVDAMLDAIPDTPDE